MRITGTQYTIEKKAANLELKYRGQIVGTFEYVGKTLLDVTEEVWTSLKRKGVIMQRNIVKDDIAQLFPGVRVSGPLK